MATAAYSYGSDTKAAPSSPCEAARKSFSQEVRDAVDLYLDLP